MSIFATTIGELGFYFSRKAFLQANALMQETGDILKESDAVSPEDFLIIIRVPLYWLCAYVPKLLVAVYNGCIN